VTACLTATHEIPSLNPTVDRLTNFSARLGQSASYLLWDGNMVSALGLSNTK